MIALHHSFLSRVAQGLKGDIQKRDILRTLVCRGELSITDISKQVNLSIPTVTKFLGELIDEGFVSDCGYESLPSARRAVLYGLKRDAGFFVGVDVKRTELTLALMAFDGTTIAVGVEPFEIGSDLASVDELCRRIKAFVAAHDRSVEEAIAVGVSLTGRVDSAAGLSYSFYYFDELPFAQLLSERLATAVYLENDSRAMAYGEYLNSDERGTPSTMIFVNLSWGLGVGMVIEGKLFYGKSGFSGEYGHIPMGDNQILCQCGKRGCLETAVSGSAARRLLLERLDKGSESVLEAAYQKRGDITLHEIIDAVQAEDMLAIEVIEQIGQTLGKAVSGLINMFNPDSVVLGGELVAIKEYLMLPLRGGVNKYSLRLVSRDTAIRSSTLGPNAAAVGVCLLVRSKVLCLL